MLISTVIGLGEADTYIYQPIGWQLSCVQSGCIENRASIGGTVPPSPQGSIRHADVRQEVTS